MPLYEYQCLQCGKRTEVLQRLDEAPLAACPQCGGEVKKLISSPAFQFKGSGWYVTDYAGK
ncbi:MAG TPA: FmdB family zinc ribbon protein, partial [Thermoanaerobaculia bacterium]